MIYVYLKQCVQLAKNSAVRLGDVAQVVALGGGVKEARAAVLGRLEDSPFLLTAADVVFALGREDVAMLGAPGLRRGCRCRLQTSPPCIGSRRRWYARCSL